MKDEQQFRQLHAMRNHEGQQQFNAPQLAQLSI